ncbi:MAG TPA: LysM peptidoglycan-binding domain-containing protein, partial [Roseiflexaceae bacterium]|nr:LysM peptidoglycan-binding domain-containing protein [Roseiflexaceae bacterium]
EVVVEASVTILHVEVKFHYQLAIEQSFSIGAKTTPPWIVDTGAAPALPAGRTESQGAASRAKRTLSAEDTSAAAGTTLDWSAVPVWAAPKTVALSLLPAFTAAVPQAAGESPYAIVMLLFVENTIPVDAASAQDAGRVTAEHSTRTTDPQEVPFNLLVKGLLAWAIHAYLGRLDGSVARDDLNSLYQALDQADATHSNFSYQNLADFIAQNFIFQIAGIPQGYSDSSDTNQTSATIVPMIPELAMTLPGRPAIDFRTNTSASQTYEDKIDAYFQQFTADSQAGVAADPFVTQQIDDANVLRAASGESLATMLFRDYFAMLAKAAVQAAIDTLSAYQYAIAPGDTLQGIANSFAQLYTVQPGDSVPSLLEQFGMRRDAFQQLNGTSGPANLPLTPGDHVRVWMSVTPSSIAQANADHELANGLTLTVKHLTYQIKSGDTFASIAAAFGIADINALAQMQPNSTSVGILLPGVFLTIASMDTPDQLPTQIPYQTVAGDSLALIAAWLFVRIGELRSDPATPDPILEWYKQAIANLNSNIVTASNTSADLPAGATLTIPAAQNDPNSPVRSYTIHAGDTVDLIAGYYTALQTRAAYEAGIETHISDLNPGVDFTQPGQAISLPARRRVIQPTDSLASIAGLFGLSVDDLVNANARAAILNPRAQISLPDLQHQAGQHETLAGIAAHYNTTVAQLADDNTFVSDLFGDPQTLLIPELRQLDIADLLDQAIQQRHCNQIAGMLSRFLLHGLRLPAPDDQKFLGLSEQDLTSATQTTVDLFGLYDLVGQQFTSPSLNTTPYTVSFASSGAAWIQFAAAFVVQNSDTLDALKRRYPNLEALNPAAQLQPNLLAGSVLIGELLTAGLDLNLTGDLLRSHYPATSVLPEIVSGPQPLKLFEDVSIRYSLRQHIRWQTAVNPSFVEATASALAHSQPSIWLFSSTLLAAIADTAGAPMAYNLMAESATHSAQAQIAPVASYAWATAMQIQVQQTIPTEDRLGPLPNTYILKGADETSRDLMLALWAYLNEHGSDEDGTSIYLLYAPGMDSANPTGLASGKLDPTNTFLLKTNLSTLTTSGAQGPIVKRNQPPETAELFYANITDVQQFIQFLWEGSITGTGGYYFNYASS